MHDHLDLLLTLTGGLAAALALGYVTHRLGLSPIVGYLLAGVALGPNTPGFVANRHLAEQLAEVGVILLMFGVGLHFHFKELLAVRRVALPGAVVQSLVATALGTLAALMVGWGWVAGVVYGLSISVASTVVLVRVLSDHHDLHTPTGHIAVGWLVVEDLLTVVVLVALPALFAPTGEGVALALGWAALKIGILVGFTLWVGGRVIPWLLGRMAATRSRELFTLTVLVVALGIAVGSARFFGVSMALGAFLAGMVVGRSEFSLRAATDALPMRDAFAVLFFVSVGMLFEPASLLNSPGLILATLGIVLVGKPVAALVIVVALKYPPRVALAVAVALAQIGEFSFILAALGREFDLVPREAMNALVAAAIVSISINPLLYGGLEAVEKWARQRPRLWSWLTPRGATSTQVAFRDTAYEVDRQSAIVIGYGPVGRTLVRLLRESEIEPTVVEMNLDTLRRLREHGIRAVYGDATHADTLKEAGAAGAAFLLLSSAGMRGSEETIRLARLAKPTIEVLARANYLRELPSLRRAGANEVYSGEGEVALSMTESLLKRLGATAEQIERESDRIRRELFGSPLAIEVLSPPPAPMRTPNAPFEATPLAESDGPTTSSGP